MRPSERGRVVVTQQPDGWWRWRFESASPGGEVLVSNEAHPEREEAIESARQAYPSLYPDVEAPRPPPAPLPHPGTPRRHRRGGRRRGHRGRQVRQPPSGCLRPGS